MNKKKKHVISRNTCQSREVCSPRVSESLAKGAGAADILEVKARGGGLVLTLVK